MRFARTLGLALFAVAAGPAAVAGAEPGGGGPLDQPPNTWVQRSPGPDAPPSPRLGYEASWGYDPRAGLLIRWGGHNQGGGGEQNAETWTFNPRSGAWSLKEPNDAPPGVCCAQQNVFDPARGRFVRFPAFSGSHGWQWFREIDLKNSSVWTYDLPTNTWRDRRPVPEPRVSPLRCASWDSDHEVIVVFGGEGNDEGTLVFDPYTNTWNRRHPPEQPPFRSGGNMAYDDAHKLHILFGSQFHDDPHTWAYDLRADRWRDLKPARQPPTDRNDAVLTYDPLHQLILAVVKISEGEDERQWHRLETWAFDAGRNTWTKPDPAREPDASGARARLLTFLPDLDRAILESRTHPPQGPAEQQIWTYRHAPIAAGPGSGPAPPPELELTANPEGASLRWRPSPSAGVTGYRIERGEGPRSWEAEARTIGIVAADRATFQDRDLAAGTVAFYTVRALDAEGRAGPASPLARTRPPLVEDLVASVRSPEAVELTWNPPRAGDIVGYRVERAGVEVWTEDQLPRLKSRLSPLPEQSIGALRRIGAFVPVHDGLVRQPRYADAVDLAHPRPLEGEPSWTRRLRADQRDEAGKSYRWAVFAYRVRAVNALGVEGGPSPYVLTIPSAPQHVCARERGTRCDLRWARNPEEGLAGYRVYRLDGRYDRDPIRRLTPEPHAGATFTDPEAGSRPRRYIPRGRRRPGPGRPPLRPGVVRA